jgi:hypothetical protein
VLGFDRFRLIDTPLPRIKSSDAHVFPTARPLLADESCRGFGAGLRRADIRPRGCGGPGR